VFHYVNGKYDLHQRVYRMYGFSESVLAKYFYYYFSTHFYDRVMSMTAKTSVDSVRYEMIADMDIILPKVEEQRKICSCFEQLDNLITLHQRKAFSISNRFKVIYDIKNTITWEQRKFGDCVLIQRGGSPRPIEDYITNDENGVNWIKIGDVAAGSRYITSTKEKIKPEGVKKSRCVEVGDLILSNSMSFGRPYIMQINGCIHDGWLLIRDEKKMFNLEYLLQLLSSDYMFNQYKALAAGGVVNNLNSELVQSTIAMIPSLPEQVVIGKFFSKLDNLITLHQRGCTFIYTGGHYAEQYRKNRFILPILFTVDYGL